MIVQIYTRLIRMRSDIYRMARKTCRLRLPGIPSRMQISRPVSFFVEEDLTRSIQSSSFTQQSRNSPRVQPSGTNIVEIIFAVLLWWKSSTYTSAVKTM